jgi:hypothetical protein
MHDIFEALCIPVYCTSTGTGIQQQQITNNNDQQYDQQHKHNSLVPSIQKNNDEGISAVSCVGNKDPFCAATNLNLHLNPYLNRQIQQEKDI